MSLKHNFIVRTLVIILLLPDIGFAFEDGGSTGDSKSPRKEEKSLLKKEMEKTFNSAMTYFYEGNYDKSLPLLKELVKNDPDNPQFNFYLGVCHLISTSPVTKAQPYLEKAVTATTIDYYPRFKYRRAPAFAFYYLAIVYHYEYEFNKALTYFRKFRSLIPIDESILINDVDLRISMTRAALRLVKTPVDTIRVTKFPNINSDYNDFGAYMNKDETLLFYTSKRFRFDNTGKEMIANGQEVLFTTWESSLQIPKLSKADNEYKSSIFFIKKEGRSWSSPQYFSSFNDTESNSQFGCLSNDGKYLYFNSDSKGNHDLYYSVKMTGDKWSTPQELGPNVNTKSDETNACLSPDGNTLYFVSNRKDGLGGKDIYYSNKLEDGTWGKAVNLGRLINTPEDEESPYISEDGNTLYFSSRGHQSMGGYDIYYSKAIGDNYYNKFITNNWKRPENIGYPINTVFDDLCYKVFNKDKITLYTSNSMDGSRNMDIFIVSYKTTGLVDTSEIKPTLKPLAKEDVIIETYAEKPIVKVEEEGIQVKDGLVNHLKATNGKTEKPVVVPEAKVKYTVQLGSGEFPAGYFDKVKNVKIYYDERGIKRYCVGEYDNMADAEGQRTVMIALGYVVATVIPLDTKALSADYIAKKVEESKVIEETAKEEPFVKKPFIEKPIAKEGISKEPEVKEPVLKKPVVPQPSVTTRTISTAEKLYTIQVGAGNMKMEYFNKLDGVREFIGEDGMKRFMVGEYKTFTEAVAKKKEIVNLGYQAWIKQIDKEVIEVTKITKPKAPEPDRYELVEKYPCKDYDNNIYYIKYTVQVGAGNMKYEYFNKLNDVVICEGLYGLKRFVVGEFDALSAAKLYRLEVINLGYHDAWIPNKNDHLCNCYKLADVYAN